MHALDSRWTSDYIEIYHVKYTVMFVSDLIRKKNTKVKIVTSLASISRYPIKMEIQVTYLHIILKTESNPESFWG